MGRASVHGLSFNLQGLAELSQTFGEAERVGVVSAKVLEFTLKGSVVLLSSSPIDHISMNLVCSEELLDTWPIRASSHGWVHTGMERPRVNSASTSLGGQKLWKGTIEVIQDKKEQWYLVRHWE